MSGIILGIILSIAAHKLKHKKPNESQNYDYVGEGPGGVNSQVFQMEENDAYGSKKTQNS